MCRPRLILLFALCCFLHSISAQNPCSSLDAGPFLGTKPTLTMRVYEASQTDLEQYPDSDNYKDELRLTGSIGGPAPTGITLEVMNDFRLFDPREVFEFQTEAVTGKNLLKLVKAVDRDGPTDALDDDVNMFTFTLKCSPVANTSIEVYYDVRIQVMDVNDNFPRFVGAPYSATINELTPVGSTILRVSAVDIDSPVTSNVTYSIVPANVDDGSSMFSIDSINGDVTVTAMLDYEALSQGHAYNLELMATDGDVDGPKSAKVTAIVTVTDGDDQGPAFEFEGCFRHKGVCAWPKYTSYASQMKLAEPITVYPVPNKVGQPVSIKARDLDPSMSEVKFSIASTIPPGFESHFSVATSHASGAFYAASVKQETALTVSEGFEIFLKVEETSNHMRHEIAMIYFMGQNKGGSSGSQSTQKTASGTDSQVGDPGKSPISTGGTSEETLALIVVVAILAAFVVCLTIAFFCYISRRRDTKGSKYIHESRQTTGGQRNGISSTQM
ncbi:protocadherin-15-like isoform X1 [Haliotis rufescens]|uniref:protocadherin-15-like isoform X1 n=1 Tax=Haliotis rufescens TaxID=6454 RepID=UPI00201EAB16|nr:protocadherin-15-like isoform X1 [Haliotis rufescens]